MVYQNMSLYTSKIYKSTKIERVALSLVMLHFKNTASSVCERQIQIFQSFISQLLLTEVIVCNLHCCFR